MCTKFATRNTFSFVFGIFHRFCRNHFLSFDHDDNHNWEDDYMRQIYELTIVSEAFVSFFYAIENCLSNSYSTFLFSSFLRYGEYSRDFFPCFQQDYT